MPYSSISPQTWGCFTLIGRASPPRVFVILPHGDPHLPDEPWDLELFKVDWLISFLGNLIHKSILCVQVAFVLADGHMVLHGINKT